jgi:hypothetical protein
VEAIFADDITGIYGTDWVLFRYNPTSNSYEEVGLQDAMQVGQGYWIINTGNTAILDMPANSLPVGKTRSACFEAAINSNGTNQWRLLANPFSHSYQWSELRGKAATGDNLCNGSDGCSLAEMQTAGLVQDQGWHFDSNAYVEIKEHVSFPLDRHVDCISGYCQ